MLAASRSLSKLKIWVALLVSVTMFAIAAPLNAQESSSSGNQIDGYAVVLDGNSLFRVREGIPGVATAQERADVINDRLAKLANNSAIPSSQIRAVEQNGTSVVKAGEEILFTVSDGDRLGDQSRPATAEQVVQILRSAVAHYRQARGATQVARGVLLALLSTLGLMGFLLFVQRASSQLLTRIQTARRADRLSWGTQNARWLGSNATSYLLSELCKLLRLVLVLGSFYLYIPFLLSQFPATRLLGNSIFSDIAARADWLLGALIQYLPNLGIIVIIALLTYYLIQFAKLVIIELGRDDAYPWFYQEWTRPTNRLAAFFLTAIACVIAAPYLPGFGSPAFQGISLFLGALLTLGSSSAIANAISGVIIIYNRAFKLMDMIRIQDITGEVIEKSLFVTRILTPKQEIITIPNSSVLNSNIVNYSTTIREKNSYLILHTTVTLGYDVPWRKVHHILINAAKATHYICAEPPPFVLQTALNDFNVSYELNAYTDRPVIQDFIYSNLHENIQDYCNEAGIEILSPAFSALRDGNHSTIPAEHLPEDYVSPSFQIDN